MEVSDQSHTDSMNSDTVDTHTLKLKRQNVLLEEEGDMLIDEHSLKDNMKRKVSSVVCQPSRKVKKVSSSE